MKKVRVGIIDDNLEFCRNVRDYLIREENIEIAFIANDGLEGIRCIDSKRVDIIILDIIMPTLDGFGVLEHLNENLEPNEFPQIIAVSAVSQDMVIQKAISLGASFFMVKPINMGILFKRIIQLCNLDQSYIIPRQNYINQSVVNESISGYELELRVTDLIHELGVPANLKGYRFLRDAISLSVMNMDVMNAVTKELYPAIAEINSTTPSKVERAIRHAIEVVWRKGNLDKLEELFGFTIREDKGKPTNSNFIAIIADKLRLERKVG